MCMHLKDEGLLVNTLHAGNHCSLSTNTSTLHSDKPNFAENHNTNCLAFGRISIYIIRNSQIHKIVVVFYSPCSSMQECNHKINSTIALLIMKHLIVCIENTAVLTAWYMTGMPGSLIFYLSKPFSCVFYMWKMCVSIEVNTQMIEKVNCQGHQVMIDYEFFQS